MKILKTVLLSTALMMGTTFGSASVEDGSQNSTNLEAMQVYKEFLEFKESVTGAVIRVLTSNLNGHEAKTITLNGSEINENSEISDIVAGVGTVIKGLVKERAELEKTLSDAKAGARQVEETAANVQQKNSDELTAAKESIEKLVKERAELEKTLSDAKAGARQVEETAANVLQKNNDELTVAKESIEKLTSELKALKDEKELVMQKMKEQKDRLNSL